MFEQLLLESNSRHHYDESGEVFFRCLSGNGESCCDTVNFGRCRGISPVGDHATERP